MHTGPCQHDLHLLQRAAACQPVPGHRSGNPSFFTCTPPCGAGDKDGHLRRWQGTGWHAAVLCSRCRMHWPGPSALLPQSCELHSLSCCCGLLHVGIDSAVACLDKFWIERWLACLDARRLRSVAVSVPCRALPFCTQLPNVQPQARQIRWGSKDCAAVQIASAVCYRPQLLYPSLAQVASMLMSCPLGSAASRLDRVCTTFTLLHTLKLRCCCCRACSGATQMPGRQPLQLRALRRPWWTLPCSAAPWTMSQPLCCCCSGAEDIAHSHLHACLQT